MSALAHRPHPLRGGRPSRRLLLIPGLLLGAVALGLAVPHLPLAALGLFPIAGLAAFLGIESLIVLAWLAAFGLLPFVEVERVVAGFPVYILGFVVASGLMLAAWVGRELSSRPTHRLEPSLLFGLTFVVLAYSLARLITGSPTTIPSLSLPFVSFPIAALLAALWLSHGEAVAGLRRVWPLVLALLVMWSVMYSLGSAGGCGVCQRFVGSGLQSNDVLGSTTRLFTSGQNALLGLVLVGVALLMYRPTVARGALVALALAAVALQASRAQYGGVLAGVAVLLAWRLRWSSPGARLLIVGLGVLALAALISSPVGHRGLSAVTELQQGSGNGGYRLGLLSEQRQHYSTFGEAVSESSLDGQINYDLGIPNTIVVLGWVGAALQLALVALAAVRGLRAGTLAGATLAAIMVLVLVTRFSLPLLEGYYSAPAFGLAVGFAIALRTRSTRR